MSRHYDPDHNCLTKAEIARFLRISQRQAARLMMTMKTVAIGQNQRRVLRKDFDEWLDSKREVVTAMPERALDARIVRRRPRGDRASIPKISRESVATLAAKMREERRAKNVT